MTDEVKKPVAKPKRTKLQLELAKAEGQIKMGENWARKAHAMGFNGLTKIRRDQLYRETHDSFEEYCRDRWGINKLQFRRFGMLEG